MVYFYICMVSIFFAYVIGIAAKYGILGSISESYYKLPVNGRFLFTFFCWGISLPAMILAETGLMFVAAMGIALVGAATAFREKFTHNFHMAGAFVGVIFSQLSIAFDFHMYWINITFLSFIALIILWTLILNKNIKYFYWMEIVSFLSIMVVLYSKI